jgi:hypothetical protein
MTYLVTTVDKHSACSEVGRYKGKLKAMMVAKKAAGSGYNCVPYGPTSLAFVGRKVTAVVAWETRIP